jgi:F-type H+-transporting ATPase subunit delta
MKSQYAQAFIASIVDGMPVDTALAGLARALESKKHTKLLAPVLLEVLRTLEAQKGTMHAVVTVSSLGDKTKLKTQIEAVLADMGVTKDTPVKETVDETLVGGFVATFDHKEYDQSYKKSLKSLYESITK